MRSRSPVPGTTNFRSVGPAGWVRPGVLWRADALDDLGSDARRALAGLELRTVVDLREPVEQAAHPDDLAGLDVAELRIPLVDGAVAAHAHAGLDDLYRRMLDACGARFAAVVHLLAEPGALPAVVHCSAGKDRTGLVAVLVLSAIGVPDDVVAADYARTADLLTPEARERIVRRAVAAGVSVQEVAAAADSPAAAAHAALAHLRGRYGGAAGYLSAHGVGRDEIAVVRDALLPDGRREGVTWDGSTARSRS